MEEEDGDKMPAEEGGEVGVGYEKASFTNQKPPLSLSCHNRRRAGEAAPEFAQEHEYLQHQQAQTTLLPKKEKEEVTWTWRRRSLQGHSVRIKLSYRKTVFEDIRSVLTTVGGQELLQQFLDGCFGHLMYFIGGTSCSRALHELISREINLPGAREDELWFHISGTNIRFSPSEYALVTGLRFGSFCLGSQDMPSNGVYKRFCRGHQITIQELLKRFNLQRVHGSPEDYLKVANILALYLMFLGYENRKKIEQWVWVLVEDLDSWNRFPWGAYTYQALVHYIGKVPRTTAALGTTINLSGPAWALLIWAYEAIPHLGNACAFVTGKHTMPRCLKWSFFPSVRNVDFVHFFEQELVCFVTLEPTDKEQLQAYWVSVCTSQPLGVLYALPRTMMHDQKGAIATRDSRSDDTNSEASSAEPLEVSDIDGSARSTPSPMHTRASMRSSEGRNGGLRNLPEVFDESRFVDQVSGRVVDRLIKPVAEMVTERLMEPAVERLTQRLIPQIKQSIEDTFHRAKEVYYQCNMWEDEQKLGMRFRVGGEANPFSSKTMKKKKRKSQLSPASSEETSESSSGDERRRKRKKRCKKKKPECSDWSSSERDRHRRRRRERKRRRLSSSDSDAQDHHPLKQQHQLHPLSLPD